MISCLAKQRLLSRSLTQKTFMRHARNHLKDGLSPMLIAGFYTPNAAGRNTNPRFIPNKRSILRVSRDTRQVAARRRGEKERTIDERPQGQTGRRKMTFQIAFSARFAAPYRGGTYTTPLQGRLGRDFYDPLRGCFFFPAEAMSGAVMFS